MSIWTAGKRYLEKIRKRREVKREKIKRMKYEKKKEKKENPI